MSARPHRRAMRPARGSLRSDRRGLSEIVGTLMLVLIVVAAATTFSYFVASFQKQVQQQQALQHERSLESIQVLRLAPTLNATTPRLWKLLNFTVASESIESSTVTTIYLDGYAVKQFSAWRLNTSTGSFGPVTVGPGGSLPIGPREQLNIILNFSGGANYSFYNPNVAIRTTNYIQIELLTYLTDSFEANFLPPTAIALVSQLQSWNGTAFVPVNVFDGSNSFQAGNSTIVSWSWQVTPDNLSASGEKAVAPGFNPLYHTHNVTLTVTNSDGLLGVDTVVYP